HCHLLVHMSLSLTNSSDVIENEESNFINMVYNYDWSSTPLGPMDTWDLALKNVVNLCLKVEFPICIFIGPPDWILFYNRAFIPMLKSQHPSAFGKLCKDIWAGHFENRMLVEFNNVITTGKGVLGRDEPAELQRDGYVEVAYFYNTFSPVYKSDGTVCALWCPAQETTAGVLTKRRLKVLDEFGLQISDIESLESACHIITKVLSNNEDIPYTFIYFVKHNLNTSSESLIARLIATTFDEDDKKGRNIPDYLPEIPEIIDLTKDINKNYGTYIELKRKTATYTFLKCEYWPIYLAIKEENHVKVLLKDESQAVILSIKILLDKGQVLSVVLIYGISRVCTLDELYMEFLHLITNQIRTFLQHGRIIEEEKKRSKLLADLNYKKIAFFQGISHELKSPLTLILSPLDDVINICQQNSPVIPNLKLIRRNALRLFKLINSLLKLSDIETNQLKANYCETNIVEFTQELASDFKGMAKALGLDYHIDIPHQEEFYKAVGDKIYLDRDMYETIVFNLCSNAFKHTWKGQITIRLSHDYKDKNKIVVLEVSDTGVGIPEIALPNIFQRFYRVESQEKKRSNEGTGIGLALVKELIAHHGGDITVTSVVNQGTTFKCWFQIGCNHLPINQIYNYDVINPIKNNRELSLYTNRQLYLEESSQWINNSASETQDVITDQLPINNQEIDEILKKDDKKYQVLIVDDNNSM
ncbi:2882_t:CDS:10, partial [Scutellospora calospora]